MPSFEIAVGYGGDHVVRLVVDGDLDVLTARQLLESVECAAASHRQYFIVVDLHNVSFIDSAGLDAIVRADRSVRDLNAHLVICDPSSAVRNVFEMTGLDDLLDVRPGWAASSLNPNSMN